VGFGIREPQDVRDVCQVADGAVVGSFLVDLIHREWKNGEGSVRIHDAVAALKAATRAKADA
jgi:tryptophan synthase alpha chain